MKNSEKVRDTIIKLGYKSIKDYTFKDIKFYDVIVCEKGEDKYTEDELLFGRDNLRQKGEAFIEQIEKKLDVLKNAYLKMSVEDKQKVDKQISKYLEILK
jgi:tRNA A22 N-methylase